MPEQPTPEEITNWHRWFAVECNNRAWDLAEKTSATEAEKQEMLDAAYAAKYHWSQVGNEVNFSRADGLVAEVLALLGQGEASLRYAERHLAFVLSHESPDWEVGFAHAIMANAAAAAGEARRCEEYNQLAEDYGKRLTDEYDQKVFQTMFRRVEPA